MKSLHSSLHKVAPSLTDAMEKKNTQIHEQRRVAMEAQEGKKEKEKIAWYQGIMEM